MLLDARTRNTVAELHRYFGEITNNQSEYRALIMGLEYAKSLNCEQITCYLDSELIVKQLNGQYKVKNAGIKPLFAEVQALRLSMQATFTHIPREKNARADALANRAMDEGPAKRGR